MSMSEKESFFSIGIQYYVTARFSASAELMPVCGNLFHHAVEMCLKGHLSSKLTLTELKNLGHCLKKIWNCFKLEASDTALDRFDRVISELDKFESIRYPDQILSHGMQVLVSWKEPCSTLNGSTPKRPPEPAYEIFVEQVDSLVEAIFRSSSVNPSFFTDSLNSDAKTYLNKENEALLTQNERFESDVEEEKQGEKEGITARQVIWAIIAFLILVYFLSS